MFRYSSSGLTEIFEGVVVGLLGLLVDPGVELAGVPLELLQVVRVFQQLPPLLRRLNHSVSARLNFLDKVKREGKS